MFVWQQELNTLFINITLSSTSNSLSAYNQWHKQLKMKLLRDCNLNVIFHQLILGSVCGCILLRLINVCPCWQQTDMWELKVCSWLYSRPVLYPCCGLHWPLCNLSNSKHLIEKLTWCLPRLPGHNSLKRGAPRRDSQTHTANLWKNTINVKIISCKEIISLMHVWTLACF